MVTVPIFHVFYVNFFPDEPGTLGNAWGELDGITPSPTANNIFIRHQAANELTPHALAHELMHIFHTPFPDPYTVRCYTPEVGGPTLGAPHPAPPCSFRPCADPYLCGDPSVDEMIWSFTNVLSNSWNATYPGVYSPKRLHPLQSLAAQAIR